MTPEWLCCRRRGVERGGGLLWGPLLLEAAQPGARDVRGFSPGRRHVESGEVAERGEQETRPRALGRPGAARRTTPSPVPCDPLVTAADPGASLTHRETTFLQVQHIPRALQGTGHTWGEVQRPLTVAPRVMVTEPRKPGENAPAGC